MAVSVVVPIYNSEAYLSECLEGLLAQSMRDFEVLLINNGSTDASAAICQGYVNRDQRFRYFELPEANLIWARNFGLAEATYPLVALQDSDDISKPDRLAQQVAFLRKAPDIVCLGGQIETFSVSDTMSDDASGGGQSSLPKSRFPERPADIHAALARGKNPMAQPTVMMRKDSVRRVGGYRAAFDVAEDYDLWLRLDDHDALANLPNVLVSYRSHEGNITKEKASKLLFSHLFATLCRDRRKAGLLDPADHMSDGYSVDSLEDDVLIGELIALKDLADLYYAYATNPAPVSHKETGDLADLVAFIRAHQEALNGKEAFRVLSSLAQTTLLTKALLRDINRVKKQISRSRYIRDRLASCVRSVWR